MTNTRPYKKKNHIFGNTAILTGAFLSGLMFLIIILFPGLVTADREQAMTEYEIKAGFLYNFLFFVQWPETHPDHASLPEGSIVIGIVGTDPFGDHFSKVEGKTVRQLNRKLVINRYGAYSKETDFNTCHLLFISSSEKKNFKKIINSIKDAPILTISDDFDFIENGGIIKLLTIKGKVRWEINKKSVNDTGLKISAQ